MLIDITDNVEVDMSAVIEESFVEKEHGETIMKSTVETVTLSQTTNFDTSTALPLLPETTQLTKDQEEKIADLASDSEHEIPKVTADQLVQEDIKEKDVSQPDKTEDKKLDLEVKDITNHQEKDEQLSIASVVELDHSYGLAPRDATPPIDVVGLENQTPEKEPTIEFVTPKVEKKQVLIEKPVPVRKHLFPVRSFKKDDELVYEFLQSGLDYEDAHFLKVGFDQLNQVCSESVADAKWSFHPDILTYTNILVFVVYFFII